LLAKTKVGQSKLRHLLPHKRAMLYFVQPSTRTFLSFQNACHILGLTTSEIRGTSRPVPKLKVSRRKIPFVPSPVTSI
jgi:aspartate carbamoyltransferase catalytic subunit